MNRLASVTSNDATVEQRVAEWLADSRMPLPRGLRVEIDVVDRVGVLEDARDPFPQGDVLIRAGEPLGWVHIEWTRAPAIARIDEHRPEAHITLSRDAAREIDELLRGFLLIVFIFLWKRDGRYHVHAASALDPKGRGWMLIGNSRSGKSTTAAFLAARGWRVSTDDIAFLYDAGERTGVIGFRSRVALRPGGTELLGTTGGLVLPLRGKTGFWPEDLGGGWVQTVEPDILLFTSIGGNRTSLVPMGPADILKELLQWSLWVMFERTAAQEHLDLISRLGRQAQCFRANLAPDLFAAPNALEDYLPWTNHDFAATPTSV